LVAIETGLGVEGVGFDLLEGNGLRNDIFEKFEVVV
jgi:hypothetical protein